MTAILDGMRVVEGSAFIAAPSGGMTLAALGAQVIRFDNIGGGLDYRRWPVTDSGSSIYWADLNKGKHSIAVDLRNPAGQEIVTQLITAPGPDAGLFLTNFPARGWLSYDALKQHRDDLIQVSIQGDRHGGTALDYTVNARVALPLLTGNDPQTPVNSPLPAWDFLCGQHAAVSILAAERQRGRSGQGQEIKLALADIAYATVANLGYIGEKKINGEARQNTGNSLYGAFGRDFRSSDGVSFMVVAITRRQWTSLLAATACDAEIDRLAEKRNLNFELESDRFRAHEEIELIFEQQFSRRRFSEIQSLLDAEGVCWGVYQSLDQLIDEDPECSVHNPLFTEIDQPGIGRYAAPSYPARFGAADPMPARPAPRLGEHTDEILMTLLGMSDSQVGRLHDTGVVTSSSPE